MAYSPCTSGGLSCDVSRQAPISSTAASDRRHDYVVKDLHTELVRARAWFFLWLVRRRSELWHQSGGWTMGKSIEAWVRKCRVVVEPLVPSDPGIWRQPSRVFLSMVASGGSFAAPRVTGHDTWWVTWEGDYVVRSGQMRSYSGTGLPRSQRGSGSSWEYICRVTAKNYPTIPSTTSVYGGTTYAAWNDWVGPPKRRRPGSCPPVDSWGYAATWRLYLGPPLWWGPSPGSVWAPLLVPVSVPGWTVCTNEGGTM